MAERRRGRHWPSPLAGDDAAADLTLDEHWVDHRAAILGDREIEELDKAGLAPSARHCRPLAALIGEMTTVSAIET